ncbi:MAG: YdeI/OmpD-associated family protein [Pseudomonadota bacterium]
MSYFTHEFTGTIERHGVGKSRVIMYKVLYMPPHFEADLPFKTYPRLRVEAEIADVPVRGAWIPAGDGRRYFIVSPEIKANTGFDVGDDVEMRFKIDDQDFVDVPPALLNALEADKTANGLWADFTAGKKRMFAHHVLSAKTAPTIKRRVDEAMFAILEGISLRDLRKYKR